MLFSSCYPSELMRNNSPQAAHRITNVEPAYSPRLGDNLEQAQKGGLDITPWIIWFLGCLDRALVRADESLAGILQKSATWERINAGVPVNERQRLVLNALLDRSEREISTSQYAKLARCSLDTALRDIKSLVDCGVLVTGEGGGRSTKYQLKPG